MAILIDLADSQGEEPELPEVMCSECESVFAVIWNRRPDVRGIQFCPFCGDNIEDEMT